MAALEKRETELEHQVAARDAEIAAAEAAVKAEREATGERAAAQEAEVGRLLLEREQAVHDTRVAGLERIAALSLTRLKQARAWRTWLEGHRELQRAKGLLRGEASRLAQPLLGTSFGAWRQDW